MTTFIDMATTIVPAVVGGGGMWVYLSSRVKAKPAIVASQADLVSALNEQTKTLLAESAKDRKDLKRRVDRQGHRITQLTAQVSDCNDKHSACEVRVGDLQEQIDKLMQGPIASYPHRVAEQ